MKVLSMPAVNGLGEGESGIHTVIRKYAQHAPKFDIEFVGENDAADVIAVHAGMTHLKETGVPIVAHLHGMYWTGDFPMGGWAHSANKSIVRSLRQSSVVTVPSDWVSQTIEREMRTTPVVLPHGIDVDEWKPLNDDRDYVILYAKNRAGFDVCDPSFITEFAKRLPQQRFVATFAPATAPGNVMTTGVVPYEEMKLMVGHCSVYASTTKETFGIGALEAVAAGIPVLAFNEGGVTQFVKHGVNGYLAEVGNYDDLFDGLLYCLEHRHILGANGREVAKGFTWEKSVEKLAGIYQYAMGTGYGDIPKIIDSSLYAVV